MKELKVQADIQNLDIVEEYVTAELENAGFGEKQIMQVELAVEEIFCNIANYAYHPGNGEAIVRCSVENAEPDCARIEFVDEGIPYNPLLREEPDITLSAEEREIGGLGVFLAKKLMDTIEYSYEDGKNVLVVMKKSKKY